MSKSQDIFMYIPVNSHHLSPTGEHDVKQHFTDCRRINLNCLSREQRSLLLNGFQPNSVAGDWDCVGIGKK
jgi:hypothetical protein